MVLREVAESHADIIRSLIHVSTKNTVIEILIDAGFDDALRQPENVAVVAWNPDSGRVLLIECKDVQYHRQWVKWPSN